jgi:hypothetical protein
MKSKKPTTADLNKLVNTFTVFKFIKDMTTDFEDMKFFKIGLIDKKGNYLKDSRLVPIYYRLIINLKKLVKQIPNPSIQAKAKNLTTAISLYAEEVDMLGGDSEVVLLEINNYLKSQGLDLTEEMSTGGGFSVTGAASDPNPNLAGMDSGFMHKRDRVKNKILKRKKPQ